MITIPEERDEGFKAEIHKLTMDRRDLATF